MTKRFTDEEIAEIKSILVTKLTLFGLNEDPRLTDDMLNLIIDQSGMFILNFCSIPYIPEKLYYIWVDLALYNTMDAVRSAMQATGEDSPLTDATISQYVEAEYAIKFATSSNSSGVGGTSVGGIADYMVSLKQSVINELIPFKRNTVNSETTGQVRWINGHSYII